jgi:single-stranded DNA-binding protein
MLEGAYAHIFGKLNEDIVINKTNSGRRYGILSVSVTHRPSNKTDNFQIVVWNEFILHNQCPFLKKGKKVYVFGELGTVEQIVLQHGTPCNAIIMDVKDRFKVKVIV